MSRIPLGNWNADFDEGPSLLFLIILAVLLIGVIEFLPTL